MISGSVAGPVLLLVLVVLVLYGFLIAPASRSRSSGGGKALLPPGPYAHRGLHRRDGTAVENSMAAFRAARDGGYGMELDVNLTLDGEVVVFHDGDLQRGCGVDRKLNEMTWQEIRDLPLFGSDQTIPLFSDVLAEISGAVPLVVELKNTPRREELCRAVAAQLDRYPGAFCIESFHPGIVRWFRRHRPDVIRGQLSGGAALFTDQTPLQRLLLSGLLTNVATRPHFVAYRHQDSRTRWGGLLRLRLFRLLGGTLVGWTVGDTDDRSWCQRFFDAIIFEYFLP